MRKKERFVLGKRTFRSQKSKHFVLRIIDTPEKSLMDEEYQVLVQQAIDSLPPKCREVFRLVLSDKLKNREIADVLGISEKTVNIHIAKAYERIAEFVNRRYKEGSIK